jgi:hypothetical protein
MSKSEKPKPIEIILPDEPEKLEPQKGADDIVRRLHEALKSKEGKETLYSIGDLMYETFKGKEYSPQNVLSSIREVYNKNKADFNPRISFNRFIQSFGPGMVKLCQQKLLEIGGYNLGNSGENKDGLDGKYGKKTKKALGRYYSKQEAPKEDSTDEITATRVSYQQPSAPPQTDLPKTAEPQLPANPEGAEDVTIEPYKPGTEKGTLTPLGKLNPRISAIYGQNETVYDNKHMDAIYGKTKKEVMEFVITEDPITHKPVSFMGKRLEGGISMEMYAFLKVAEAEIQKLNLKYVPKGATIGGFEYRKMKMINGSDNGMSMHAYGAIDIDSGTNKPENGRGDIPDEVILELVKAGLAWGGTKDAAFDYLGRDPMHAQLRFPGDSPQGQAIINASPVGRKYWSVLGPMIAAKREAKRQRDKSPMTA